MKMLAIETPAWREAKPARRREPGAEERRRFEEQLLEVRLSDVASPGMPGAPTRTHAASACSIDRPAMPGPVQMEDRTQVGQSHGSRLPFAALADASVVTGADGSGIRAAPMLPSALTGASPADGRPGVAPSPMSLPMTTADPPAPAVIAGGESPGHDGAIALQLPAQGSIPAMTLHLALDAGALVLRLRTREGRFVESLRAHGEDLRKALHKITGRSVSVKVDDDDFELE